MIKKRLEKLRYILKQYNYSGYLLSTTDEYLNEYTPEYAKRLQYLTGFTGSNGLVIVLHNTALFFTDGRYITQSLNQLDNSIFKILDQQTLPNVVWDDYITENQPPIAYDAKTFSRKAFQDIKRIKLKSHNGNLIDKIWIDQPPKPSSIIYDYPIEFSGQDYTIKIRQTREFIKKHHAGSLLITDPSSVCWLLNIRAHDLEFSPLLLAYAIITYDNIYLFTCPNRYHNKKNITVLPENKFQHVISHLEGIILFDRHLCSDYIETILEQHRHQHISNPCIEWKAQKNSSEIKYMKKGHVEDAIAVCETLAFLDSTCISNLSEYDIGKKLKEFRITRQGYIMDSFPTICGFKQNSAIIHYQAKRDTAKKLSEHGLLLIDSGGQYLGATTDVTRTIPIGQPTDQYRDCYTKVLKGHIALGLSIFPDNKITGTNLDILARQFLWKDGQDYPHSTGHGVGSFLNVHEGPQSVSLARTSTTIKKGMVISNEPGYYLPGKFGIRIENMMYVTESKFQGFLQFQMLTLIPYSKELILIDMLSQEEISYLKKYYADIHYYVAPHLSNKALLWLIEQTTL